MGVFPVGGEEWLRVWVPTVLFMKYDVIIDSDTRPKCNQNCFNFSIC